MSTYNVDQVKAEFEHYQRLNEINNNYAKSIESVNVGLIPLCDHVADNVNNLKEELSTLLAKIEEKREEMKKLEGCIATYN